MAASVALLVLLAVVRVAAHSWVGCADYRGPVDYYDDTKCFAYPRNWATARGAALTPIAKGYQLGTDTGYNYQGSETAACQLPMTNPIDNAYTTRYPKAIYEQGQTYCLAWPTKNHVAASCTNQYIPDTTMKLFRSSVNPTTNPTQTDFKRNEVTTNFGAHTNGQIDCLGFQRSPKFCENSDKALATGCFTVPSTQPVGNYIYQWFWVFNSGDTAYSTCWDAQVVARGSGRGGGGLLSAATVTDTLNGGTSGSTCRTNWANVRTVTVPSTPSVGTLTGTAAPATPTTNTQVGLNGDSVRCTYWPTTIPRTNGATFTVNVAYTSTGSRQLLVDILDARGLTWYGKGTATITSTGGSTSATTITLTVNTASGTPTLGSSVILRAWLVDAQVYQDYLSESQKPAAQQDPSKVQPWTKELSRNDVIATVGTQAIYPASSAGMVDAAGMEVTDDAAAVAVPGNVASSSTAMEVSDASSAASSASSAAAVPGINAAHSSAAGSVLVATAAALAALVV
jgi:hypothetical protein